MKITALSSVLLLASGVLAASRSVVRRARTTSRRAGSRRSLPAANHVYETNWAGAVIETTGVQSVTGTFVAPVPATDGSGAAWVGIDGNDCYTGILQAGINWHRSGANVTYDAWYEWFPASMAYWTTGGAAPGFAIEGGDALRVTVAAASTRSGTALLENLTRNTSVAHDFAASETLSPICQTDAEWIVEDYYENFDFVAFADFGTVTFTDASAVTAAGTIGLAGADAYDIEQDGVGIRTNSSIVGDSSVAVTWIR